MSSIMDPKPKSFADFAQRKRSIRLSEHQTKALVERIPALQSLFSKKTTETEDFSDSVAYLSRFAQDMKRIEPAPEPSQQREKKHSTAEFSFTASVLAAAAEEEDHVKEKSQMTSQMRKEKRRLAMSLASLAAKPDMREKLVRDGAIAVLLDMSAIPDRLVQRSCIAAFCSLSKEPKLRSRMIEEGAMSAAVGLSSIVHNVIVFECCKTLCNLCMEPNAEVRALKDGVPFAIMHALTLFPNCIEVCLKTLLNLSCVPERYQRIEEIADALMHFNGFALSIENEIIIASALCNLSALKNFQLRLVEDGCLRFVEKVISSGNRQLRVLAGRIIDNLTTDSRTRGKMVDNGIIQMLLITSRDEAEEVRTSSVKAFYNLARDMICRERIVHANAVTVIVKLSTDTIQNVLLGRTAARILRILCSDSRIANKLVQDGIIKALMNLLRTDDGVIQQYCAESICSMFQIEEVKGRLIDQGAVGILVQLSQNTTNPITSEWCAFALFHLAMSRQCPRKMLEMAVLPCVMHLADHPSSNTKYFCAATLDLISKINEIDSAAAIPLLVDMLRNSSNDGTKTSCASALYNMADIDENCRMILEAGALLPVVDLTVRGSTNTKKKCAAILSKLSIQSEFHEYFNSGNVLRVLLELSHIDDVYTQRKVIIAISNLSQSQELRQQLLSLNPIPYIMTLASKCDENVRRGCASIICNLAFDAGSEMRIAETGIVSTLLITAMITSDQVESKIICVKAFVNLMADERLYQRMVKDGLIWGLSSLSNIGDSEIRLLCLKALSKLSHNFAAEMLASTPCVKTVTKAVHQVENVELTRFGARTLTNLLVKSTDADLDFRQLAVGCLQNHASSQDKEISEITVLCLCLASQSEACRESIVRAGILTRIDASSIFSEPRVCSAYLTMFENIALNPVSRSDIIDEKCIVRFKQICLLNDAELCSSVSRCLYYISCSATNLPILVDQGTLALIDLLLNEIDYEPPSFSVVKLLISTVHNLCTADGYEATLVSQGVVNVMKRMWEPAKDEFKPCALLIKTVCLLACARINTAKLVKDGCAEILCFVENHKMADYPACNFNFTIDLLEKVSISFRNILSVISNQETMINHGCLEVIMALADEAESYINEMEGYSVPSQSTKRGKSAKGRDSTFSRKISMSPSKMRRNASREHFAIRAHCASALRSITYNESFRALLVQCGAMNFILDAEAQSADIPLSLLSEMEKESWQNGSRGPHKEIRVINTSETALDLSLLGTTRTLNVDDVTIHTPPLEKFHVCVDVYEAITINTARVGMMETLELGIDNLASYGDSDEYDHTVVMSCPKLDASNDECVISEQPPASTEIGLPSPSPQPMALISPTIESSPVVSTMQDRTISQSGQKPPPLSPVPDAKSHHHHKHNSSSLSIDSISSDEASEGSHLNVTGPNAASSPAIQRRGSRDGIAAIPKHLHADANHSKRTLVRGKSAGPARRHQSPDPANRSMVTKSMSRPSTAASTKKQQPDKAFKNLMTLIRLSKASKGESLGTVIDQWRALSKY